MHVFSDRQPRSGHHVPELARWANFGASRTSMWRSRPAAVVGKPLLSGRHTHALTVPANPLSANACMTARWACAFHQFGGSHQRQGISIGYRTVGLIQARFYDGLDLRHGQRFPALVRRKGSIAALRPVRKRLSGRQPESITLGIFVSFAAFLAFKVQPAISKLLTNCACRSGRGQPPPSISD